MAGDPKSISIAGSGEAEGAGAGAGAGAEAGGSIFIVDSIFGAVTGTIFCVFSVGAVCGSADFAFLGAAIAMVRSYSGSAAASFFFGGRTLAAASSKGRIVSRTAVASKGFFTSPSAFTWAIGFGSYNSRAPTPVTTDR